MHETDYAIDRTERVSGRVLVSFSVAFSAVSMELLWGEKAISVVLKLVIQSHNLIPVAYDVLVDI